VATIRSNKINTGISHIDLLTVKRKAMSLVLTGGKILKICVLSQIYSGMNEYVTRIKYYKSILIYC